VSKEGGGLAAIHVVRECNWTSSWPPQHMICNAHPCIRARDRYTHNTKALALTNLKSTQASSGMNRRHCYHCYSNSGYKSWTLPGPPGRFGLLDVRINRHTNRAHRHQQQLTASHMLSRRARITSQPLQIKPIDAIHLTTKSKQTNNNINDGNMCNSFITLLCLVI
jgi:hypothetical protein